jgi:MFS family permease
MSNFNQTATDADQLRLRRIITLVGLGYLFLILCDPRDGIAKISIQFLLKDHIHLKPEQLASFIAFISLPWYFKPLAGLLTDNFSFLGTRRKGYLVFASAIAGALWLVLALIPKTYNSMLYMLLVINIALVTAQTTLGGMLVQSGQEFAATGRMSSIRNGAENLGVLTAGLIGGYVAAHFLGIGLAVVGVLLWVLVVMFVRLLKEPKAEKAEVGAFRTTLNQFKLLFSSRTMWVATGFWMLVRFSPGFQTPLFFHQTDTIHLTPEFIGYLAFINAGTGLIGSFAYIYLCKKYSLRTLLYGGVILSVLSAFCYLGYNSQTGAMLVESAAGLGTGMAFLAILDLLARSTPKGCEALGYSLIFSFGNISLQGSDVLGSSLYEKFHHNFTNMVWINSGTSALVLLAIPFLPRVLVSHTDGHHSEVGAELYHDA